MKLKTILCESTKTDFYDIYVLQSCPEFPTKYNFLIAIPEKYLTETTKQ